MTSRFFLQGKKLMVDIGTDGPPYSPRIPRHKTINCQSSKNKKVRSEENKIAVIVRLYHFRSYINHNTTIQLQ